MFQAGHHGILAINHRRAGRRVVRDVIGRILIRLVIRSARREIRADVLRQLCEVRHFPGLKSRGQCLVGKDDHGRTVLTRQFRRLQRGVEAVLNRRRREHDSR